MVECDIKHLRSLASEIYAKITTSMEEFPKWVRKRLIDIYNPIFQTLVELCKEGYDVDAWYDVFDIHQLDMHDRSTFVRSLRAMLEKLPRKKVDVYEVGMVDMYIGDLLAYRDRLIDEFYRAKSEEERNDILKAIRDVEKQLRELGVKIVPFTPDITKLLTEGEKAKLAVVDRLVSFLTSNMGVPYFDAYKIASEFVEKNPKCLVDVDWCVEALQKKLTTEYTAVPVRTRLPVDELINYANEVAGKLGITLTPEDINDLKMYIVGSLSKMVNNVREAKEYIRAWVENLAAARGMKKRIEKAVKVIREEGKQLPPLLEKALRAAKEIYETISKAPPTPPEHAPTGPTIREKCLQLKNQLGVNTVSEAWNLYWRGEITLDELKILLLCV